MLYEVYNQTNKFYDNPFITFNFYNYLSIISMLSFL